MKIILILLMVSVLTSVFYLWRDNWKGLLLCCAALFVGVLYGAKEKWGLKTYEVVFIGIAIPLFFAIANRYIPKRKN